MKGGLPPTPTGYDAESIFHQSTAAKLHGPQMSPRNSRTVKWKRTSRGWYADVKARGGLPTITVTACDPNTGDVVTYELFGREVTT